MTQQGPKYVLAYAAGMYIIYEQAVISGKIGQRTYAAYPTLDLALKGMDLLNEGEPVLLAFSNVQIDNVHDLSRD